MEQILFGSVKNGSLEKKRVEKKIMRVKIGWCQDEKYESCVKSFRRLPNGYFIPVYCRRQIFCEYMLLFFLVWNKMSNLTVFYCKYTELTTELSVWKQDLLFSLTWSLEITFFLLVSAMCSGISYFSYISFTYLLSALKPYLTPNDHIDWLIDWLIKFHSLVHAFY